MTRQELDNLVKIGQLKSEPPTRAEFDGMVDSAKKRLADARNESLAPESRFDLAYGAAHGFALAAPCGGRDIAPKTGSRSFRRLPIRRRAASWSDPDIFEGA